MLFVSGYSDEDPLNGDFMFNIRALVLKIDNRGKFAVFRVAAVKQARKEAGGDLNEVRSG